jgi:hypothetical protein
MQALSTVSSQEMEQSLGFEAITSHLMGLSRYFLDVVDTIAYERK